MQIEFVPFLLIYQPGAERQLPLTQNSTDRTGCLRALDSCHNQRQKGISPGIYNQAVDDDTATPARPYTASELTFSLPHQSNTGATFTTLHRADSFSANDNCKASSLLYPSVSSGSTNHGSAMQPDRRPLVEFCLRDCRLRLAELKSACQSANDELTPLLHDQAQEREPKDFKEAKEAKDRRFYIAFLEKVASLYASGGLLAFVPKFQEDMECTKLIALSRWNTDLQAFRRSVERRQNWAQSRRITSKEEVTRGWRQAW
jgi:hypothetical protein